MTKRLPNPKNRKEWARVPNAKAGKGQKVGNKYDFTLHLKKVGDFVETHPMAYEDVLKVKFAAYAWAYRHHCRVKTSIIYYADGCSLLIEVVSATRGRKK